jgi:hypothetical protein
MAQRLPYQSRPIPFDGMVGVKDVRTRVCPMAALYRPAVQDRAPATMEHPSSYFEARRSRKVLELD